jgi:NAD(P)-dependent dehydrogenase (short-subunit alcohol dehydrogenase family)
VVREPRVAVVTGAGSGLGRTIAYALLRDGFDTALLGRRRDALEETAGTAPPDQAVVLPTDVTDERQVAAAFEIVVSTWGRVDVMVNNAGTFGPPGDIDELDVEDWRRTVDVNLTGVFLCAREAFRVMRHQDPGGGRIINKRLDLGARAAAEDGRLLGHQARGHRLTRTLALDGRPYNIACSQIDIGNAATEMTAGMSEGTLQADGTRRPEPTFDPVHAAETVLLIARLPLDVNMPFTTIMATTMPYLGRG